MATSFDSISTSVTGPLCLLLKKNKNQTLMNYLAVMQICKQILEVQSCWHIGGSVTETCANAHT